MIRRNPYYGGSRPHHVDGYDVDLRAASPQDVLRRVERGEADWGYTLSGIYFDPALGLVEKYGVNRSQLFVRPGLTLRMLAFNLSRPLFRDNPGLRKAVNFALDRRALVAAGRPAREPSTDQYLPSIMPGFRNADVYPLEHPDLKRARVLAEGNLRGARPSSTSTQPIPMALGAARPAATRRDRTRRRGDGIPIHSASAAYFAKLATRASPGTSHSGCGARATSTRTRTSTCSSTGGSSERPTSPASPRHVQRADAPSGPPPAGKRAEQRVRGARRATGARRRPLAAVDFLNEPTLVSKRVGCVVLRPMLDLTAVCLR